MMLWDLVMTKANMEAGKRERERLKEHASLAKKTKRLVRKALGREVARQGEVEGDEFVVGNVRFRTFCGDLVVGNNYHIRNATDMMNWLGRNRQYSLDKEENRS